MRRPRVLMTSYYMPSESKIGVGWQVHALANALVELGADVTVATPCRPSSGALYAHLQIDVRGPMRTFRWAFALRRLEMSQFDVLHAHGDDYWLWRRRAGAHIRTMHGSCFSEAARVPGIKEKLRMLLLGLGELLATATADATVAVSENTRAWMPWIQTVIPNGVPYKRLAHPSPVKSPHPTVLFVGTYGNRKRGSLLVEAFQQHVHHQRPDAELRMVCSDAPVSDGVQVLGRLSASELEKEYRGAWVFCLPSSYEGFGIPYVEAMAAGCAVLATPNPGSLELSRNGTVIRVVEPADLGSALLGLLDDDLAREQLSAHSRRVAEDYDIERVAQRYLDLYAEVARRRAGSGRVPW